MIRTDDESRNEKARTGRPVAVPGAPSTRERILEAAIGLFSDSGCRGTSMRRIAGAVGLTEAALYRHFGSKTAILEAVMDLAQRFIYTPLPVEDTLGAPPGDSIFRGLLMPLPAIIVSEPRIRMISRILYIEMFHDPDVRELFRLQFMDRAIGHLEDIFRRCIAAGTVRPCDPAALAGVFGSFRSEWTFRTFIADPDPNPDVSGIEHDLLTIVRFFEDMFGTGLPDTDASEVRGTARRILRTGLRFRNSAGRRKSRMRNRE